MAREDQLVRTDGSRHQWHGPDEPDLHAAPCHQRDPRLVLRLLHGHVRAAARPLNAGHHVAGAHNSTAARTMSIPLT